MKTTKTTKTDDLTLEVKRVRKIKTGLKAGRGDDADAVAFGCDNCWTIDVGCCERWTGFSYAA